MNNPRTQSSITLITLIFAIAGCASGSGSTGTTLGSGGGGGGGSSTTQASPIAMIADKGGNVISAGGDGVSNIGTTVGKLDIPLISDQTQSDLSKVVVDGGGILTSLGKGVSDGLGKAGIADNPIGITVENTSNVVDQAGITVQSAGTLITNLGSDKLSPLAPVAQPIGGIVTTAGSKVSDLSVPLNTALSRGTVQKVTRTLSETIVPLTSKVTTLTQQVGAATQLGRPANDLLAMTGFQVANLGSQLSNSDTPVVGDLGGLVTAVGNTVGVTGILVHAPNGTSGESKSLLGNLSNLPGNTGSHNLLSPIPSTLTNVLGDVGGISGGSGIKGGLLSPLTNTLSAALGGGLSNNGITAPISTTVAALNTTASGGGNTPNVLQPVTNLLGGLLGKK